MTAHEIQMKQHEGPPAYKMYRVENQKTLQGLWRNFDGTVSPVFSNLTQGNCRNMPMDDSDFYREEGKQWFACCRRPELLKSWFTPLDIVELESLGYGLYCFTVSRYRDISEYESVFTREDIIDCWSLEPSSIWGEEYLNIKTKKQ